MPTAYMKSQAKKKTEEFPLGRSSKEEKINPTAREERFQETKVKVKWDRIQKMEKLWTLKANCWRKIQYNW